MILDESIIKRLFSIIYLYREPRTTLNVSAAELAQLVTSPEVSVLLDQSAVVTSMPNQLQMTFNPLRAIFVDKSEELPAREDFARHVVGLAGYLAQANKLQYSAIGLNYDITFTLDSGSVASRVILDRFINRDSFSPAGCDLIGGSVRIGYVLNGTRHHLYLEPEGNSFDTLVFYAHLNVHHESLDGVNAEWLAAALRTEYDEFMRVLHSVFDS